MEDDSSGGPPQRPESLLPYERWTEEALRQVPALALAYVAQNGLPGEHHLFITFRTDAPGVVIPPRLLAQYPHEITIVLQHQFWDLKLENSGQAFSVGLSFSGVPATLKVPFDAMTGFADPFVQFGLRFTAATDPAANDEPASSAPEAEPSAPEDAPAEPQVVSLDAFRKRSPTKED